MISFKKRKDSRYVVYVGWASRYYASCINEINNLIWAFGKEKVEYERIEG